MHTHRPNDVWLRILSFCSRTWFIVDAPQCAVCGAEAGSAGAKKLMQCPCARVYYCGKKHQLKDWANHKQSAECACLAGLENLPTRRIRPAPSSGRRRDSG